MTTHNTQNEDKEFDPFNPLHLIGMGLVLTPICWFLGSFLWDNRHFFVALAIFAPTYLGSIAGIKLFAQRAQLIERYPRLWDLGVSSAWVVGGFYFWVSYIIARDLIP